MSKTAIEKIKDRAADNIAGSIEFFNALDDFACGSPIEKILLLAVKFELQLGRYPAHFLHVCVEGKRFSRKDDMLGWAQYDFPLVVERQIFLLDWPVDFVFSWDYLGRGPYLVVECDGHDFHERTKEQAAKDRSRDRRLQQAGFTVFRFTGSEIWRNPCGCADQIIKWGMVGNEILAEDTEEERRPSDPLIDNS